MTTSDQNPKNTPSPEATKSGVPQANTQKISSDLQAMLMRAALSAKDSQAGGVTTSAPKSSVQPSKPA